MADVKKIDAEVEVELSNPTYRGEQGPKGDPGEQGPQGPKGDAGIYVGSTAPSDELVWIDPSQSMATLTDVVNTALGVIESGSY